MGNRTSRPTRNSPRQTALLIACKNGNVAAVREILEWREDNGERVDISARDENGQTALSFAKQSNNAEIIEIIEQNLFLRAVENDDTETVKAYLSTKESNLEADILNSLGPVSRKIGFQLLIDITEKPILRLT